MRTISRAPARARGKYFVLTRSDPVQVENRPRSGSKMQVDDLFRECKAEGIGSDYENHFPIFDGELPICE